MMISVCLFDIYTCLTVSELNPEMNRFSIPRGQFLLVRDYRRKRWLITSADFCFCQLTSLWGYISLRIRWAATWRIAKLRRTWFVVKPTQRPRGIYQAGGERRAWLVSYQVDEDCGITLVVAFADFHGIWLWGLTMSDCSTLIWWGVGGVWASWKSSRSLISHLHSFILRDTSKITCEYRVFYWYIELYWTIWSEYKWSFSWNEKSGSYYPYREHPLHTLWKLCKMGDMGIELAYVSVAILWWRNDHQSECHFIFIFQCA